VPSLGRETPLLPQNQDNASPSSECRFEHTRHGHGLGSGIDRSLSTGWVFGEVWQQAPFQQIEMTRTRLGMMTYYYRSCVGAMFDVGGKFGIGLTV
jgi:hypothetical protein